jgi:hypothetical protein
MVIAAGVVIVVLALVLGSTAKEAIESLPPRAPDREPARVPVVRPARRPVVLGSPWKDVDAPAWTRWVALMGSPKTDLVSPGHDLGMFQLSLGLLADLGYVTNVRKVGSGLASTIAADWKPPLTEGQFLHDRPMQYEAFLKAVRADRKRIERLHPDAVGRVVAGVKATLSGLLAAMKQGGPRGFDGWLKSGGDEGRFPQTTAQFRRGNQLF